MSAKGRILKDYTGQVFNELTVTEYIGVYEGKGSVWLCTCSCGGEIRTRVHLLKSGQVKSCGHIRKEKSILNLHPASTHGRSVQHPLYAVWNNMMNRCLNPKNPDYENYGGRGIRVCRRWHFYANFHDDLLRLWDSGLLIDREDVNGHYYPSNIRFVTPKESANNTRRQLR